MARDHTPSAAAVRRCVVPHEFRLYAHRGCSLELPENTMPAFQRAVDLGVDALELDVHLTRDGHPLVSHDPTAARMAGRAVAWRDLDLAEAQALDVGQAWRGRPGVDPAARFAPPSFEEVITTFPAVRLNVDIKQWSPPMVKPLLALLRRLRAEDRVTLASFQLRTLLEVRRRGYGGETAMAQAEVAGLLALPRRLIRSLPFVGTAAQVPLAAGPLRFDTPRFLARCHDLGLRVDYWTVDDPAEARRLIALGADGIMTDDAARMVAGLGRGARA